MAIFFPWFQQWGRPGIYIYAGLCAVWVGSFIYLIISEQRTLKGIYKFSSPKSYVVTKCVEIKAPKDKVFNFIADVSNWPQFAVHHVISAKKVEGNVWKIETPDDFCLVA